MLDWVYWVFGEDSGLGESVEDYEAECQDRWY